MTARKPAQITVPAAAKINLCLRILGRRPDGYHDLESVVVFADFGDCLTVAKAAGQDDHLRVDGAFSQTLAVTENNIVSQAVQAFRSHYPQTPRVAMQLQKNLPVAAGIGGGSSDAAACLRALCQLNDMTPETTPLRSIALGLGADVPVCLVGRAAMMSGIGAEISALPNWPSFGVLLVNPHVGLSTAAVFAAHQASPRSALPAADMIQDQATAVDYLKNAGNDLTAAALQTAPVVQEVLTRLAQQPQVLFHAMSGSGATCFGLFANAAEARTACQQLQKAEPDWWLRAGVTC
jgi:4-diphosphocytidyl-2-C-methyl-D-erythritol kinase